MYAPITRGSYQGRDPGTAKRENIMISDASKTGPCHFVAAGGRSSCLLSRNYTIFLSVLIVIYIIIGDGVTVFGSEINSTEAEIAFIEPDGVNDIIGEGEDYATIELGDAWDMNEETDIRTVRNMSDVVVENGVLSARTTTSSYFYLLWQGYTLAQNLGNTGYLHPIDADKYHRISVALCSNKSGNMYFYSFYGTDTSNFSVSSAVSVYDGCHIYVRDMKELYEHSGKYWTGEINGLRLDPKIANGEIEIHWVRLTSDPSEDDRFTIAWDNLSPSGAGQLDLFTDPSGTGNGGWNLVSLDDPPESGLYNWGESELPLPIDMEAGSYSICARVGGEFAGCSQQPLIISHAPQLWFTNPSYLSGPDYATDAGNPWDMDGAGDIRKTRNIDRYHFADNMLYFENTGGDPQIELSVPIPIDTSKYRYLSVRSHSDRQNNVDHGTVARLFWHPEAYDPNNIGKLENIIVYPGWQTYSLDLSEALLVPGSSPWQKQDWEVFRWDPNENTTGETWYTIIDDIKLTGMPEADTDIQIQFEIENPETEEVSLDLYYDTDDQGFNGVYIGAYRSGMSGNQASLRWIKDMGDYLIYLPLIARNMCPGDCYLWNTSQVNEGEYYLYGCLEDGVNRACRYSDVPVKIDH